MKIIVFLIGVAIISFALISCSDIGSNKIPMPFENVSWEEGFRVLDPGTVVINDDSTWISFWNRYEMGSPPPSIDFQQNTLIGVFWGDGWSGCHSAVQAIEIYKNQSNQIEVFIKPLPDLGPCFMLVSPLQVVTISKTLLPVIFSGDVPQ